MPYNRPNLQYEVAHHLVDQDIQQHTNVVAGTRLNGLTPRACIVLPLPSGAPLRPLIARPIATYSRVTTRCRKRLRPSCPGVVLENRVGKHLAYQTLPSPADVMFHSPCGSMCARGRLELRSTDHTRFVSVQTRQPTVVMRAVCHPIVHTMPP